MVIALDDVGSVKASGFRLVTPFYGGESVNDYKRSRLTSGRDTMRVLHNTVFILWHFFKNKLIPASLNTGH